MKEIMQRNGIQRLYHFTDINNLPIIAQCHGLWSKDKLEKAGLRNEIKTGGNELSLNLDRELGNWNKVHLYFCPNTPMAYRVQERTHIAALWDGVFFTDTNATKK